MYIITIYIIYIYILYRFLRTNLFSIINSEGRTYFVDEQYNRSTGHIREYKSTYIRI